MEDGNLGEKEYYKDKIAEMVGEMENLDYLFKIYHYTLAKYKRLTKEKETEY